MQLKRLSPLMLFFFFLTLLSVAASYFVRGGELFSPGNVTGKTKSGIVLGGFRSHAEFENECSQCHQPLENDLAASCLHCHISIDQEITLNRGLHNTLTDARKCAECHLEHQGTDFDPTYGARFIYDHELSEFTLLHHQVDFEGEPIECGGCHTGQEFSFSNILCKKCHEVHQSEFMDQHLIDFSLNCLECHDGFDRMANFDHAQTNFDLVDSHSEIRCGACHIEGIFTETSTECIACHEEPDIHRNMFQNDCSECHSAAGWLPANFSDSPFDHTLSTGFSLAMHEINFNGADIACNDCHGTDITRFDTSQCINCHASENMEFVARHQEQFSSSCLECHDGFDRMSNFDHNIVFFLDGRHADISCKECHVDQIFNGTPAECIACHAEPSIHAGFFGTDCDYCHQTDAWIPALLQKHNFPLDHGENNPLACQTCHNKTYSEYTCYACHEHEPSDIREEHDKEGIPIEELENCTNCHPTGDEE